MSVQLNSGCASVHRTRGGREGFEEGREEVGRGEDRRRQERHEEAGRHAGLQVAQGSGRGHRRRGGHLGPGPGERAGHPRAARLRTAPGDEAAYPHLAILRLLTYAMQFELLSHAVSLEARSQSLHRLSIVFIFILYYIELIY